ncbi:MAG: carbohydrate-binding family 9-like protein [Novipirellula sp. JB048]
MPPNPPPVNSYEAKRLAPGVSIAMDGRGSDPHWQTANALTRFSFPWIERTPPATEFRAVWNERHLYFRYRVSDADVVLGAGATAMEKVIASDRVEIFFSTTSDLKLYYGIEIDPRGEVLDYQARYHRQMDFQWSCDGLEVATSLNDDGYVVEARIPIATFKTLNCLHHEGDTGYLIAGLYRAEFSHDPQGGPVIEDWMSWIDPDVATPDFHVPSSFGTIRFAR